MEGDGGHAEDYHADIPALVGIRHELAARAWGRLFRRCRIWDASRPCKDKPHAEGMGQGRRRDETHLIPYQSALVRHDDAHPWGRPLHDQQAARPLQRENDPDIRKNR